MEVNRKRVATSRIIATAHVSHIIDYKYKRVHSLRACTWSLYPNIINSIVFPQVFVVKLVNIHSPSHEGTIQYSKGATPESLCDNSIFWKVWIPKISDLFPVASGSYRWIIFPKIAQRGIAAVQYIIPISHIPFPS